MTITIQVDDKGTVTATPGSSDGSVASASATTAGANDGGAPKVSGATGSSTSSAGNMTDIGGPPQWLSDAIGSKGNASSGAAASAGSNGGPDGQDGGAGPSF